MLLLKTFGGLRIERGEAGQASTPRPRPLALLAILAVAGPAGMSRDRILGILWPDTDPERARHALSQTLYSLRRDLEADVVISSPELKLDPRAITSDLEAFRDAIAQKSWRDAAALYAGPFLDGFYLAGAAEFERWVETERGVLAPSGMKAIEIVATEDTTSGRLEQAAESWRRLSRSDPLSARFAASYMEVLVALGDRAGALAHGTSYGELLRRELDIEPDPAVQQLMSRLRDAPATRRAGPVVRLRALIDPPSVSVTGDQSAGPAMPRDAGHRGQSRAPFVVLVLGLAGLLTTAALGWRMWAAARNPGPQVLAVGRIRDLVTPDSTMVGAVLSEMLATSLGRLHELQVVASSRMLELTPPGADTARSALTDAARRAGATEIIEGEVVPLPNNRLRLDIRRVEIARGLLRGGYQVIGDDRIALFDSVTTLIAADLRLPAPTGTLAEVSTSSPIAYRLYEDGLRAFYQFDAYAANRLFRAAIREDSAFAMATYYAWRSAVATNAPGVDTLAARAVALASHASERDRLLILAHVGQTRWDLRALAAAESLAVRHASDPEALMRAADVIDDLPRAITLLNRSIALDSVAGIAPAAVCRLCDALSSLASKYDWADSMAAEERTLTRWVRLRPEDGTPWLVMADHLVSLGRRSDAEAAQRRGEALGGKSGNVDERTLVWNLRTDEPAAAWSQCTTLLLNRDDDAFRRYRWFCTIALRMQGRLRDALRLVREGRIPGSSVVRRGIPSEAINDALLDLEMGRPETAADGFASLGSFTSDSAQYSDGMRARTTTWHLTLSVTAAVAGGDTLRARKLVDSIESTGRRSLFGRDRLLHHFVRGLLLAAAAQHAGAVREYEAANFSPTNGYTRINYELGKSLLALNRPAEAIPVMRAVLHGGIEGSGLYLTRTEAHELLARAFDAAGQRDSAAVHYGIVERAWRGADPILQPRYDAARQWLVRAGRPPR